LVQTPNYQGCGRRHAVGPDDGVCEMRDGLYEPFDDKRVKSDMKRSIYAENWARCREYLPYTLL
jgi:hypothetical protein